MPARQGKIARLPASVREEVNLRLLNGEPASKILPWLNAKEEVLRVLDEHFGEEPVSPQNLSDWRRGGYQDWLARRQRIEDLRTLAQFSQQLGAAAGGSLAEGAAAIAGGRILELLEAGLPTGAADAEGDEGGSTLESIVLALARLRKLDLEQIRMEQIRRRAEQKDAELALARDKFRRQTVEQFMRWAGSDQARAILESGQPQHVQMDLLRDLFFGKEAA